MSRKARTYGLYRQSRGEICSPNGAILYDAIGRVEVDYDRSDKLNEWNLPTSAVLSDCCSYLQRCWWYLTEPRIEIRDHD